MKIWSLTLAAAYLLMLLTQSGCTAFSKMLPGDMRKEQETGTSETDNKIESEEVSASIDVSFLLGMTFIEAKTLSAQSIEFPPFYKVAADTIEVTKTNADGTPRRVRAKGRVFIEMNFLEPAKALCQELLLTDDEVILRGKPVLQRGGSTVEGMDDHTVFYLFGAKLRVIGMHRLTNPGQITDGVDASGLPILGAWTDSPNPLLPPLTESDVPAQVRAELQRAAEAEMLHQQTRAAFGPAESAPQPAEGKTKLSPSTDPSKKQQPVKTKKEKG